MMKQYILLISFLFLTSLHVLCQNSKGKFNKKSNLEKIDNLDTISDIIINQITNKDKNINPLCEYIINLPFSSGESNQKEIKLISSYSFSKKIRNSFYLNSVGKDNSTKATTYAMVNVEDDNKFEFCPFIIENDYKKGNYRNIASIAFSGTLNNNSYFDLKEFKNLNLNLSFTRLSKTSVLLNNYFDSIKPSYRKALLDKISVPISEFINSYNNKKSLLNKCDTTIETLKLKEEIEESDLIENISNAEIEAAEKFWSKSKINYYKIQLDLLSVDNVSFGILDTVAKTLKIKPNNKYWTPKLKFDFNFCRNSDTNNQLLNINFYAGVTSLSKEIPKLNDLTQNASIFKNDSNVQEMNTDNVSIQIVNSTISKSPNFLVGFGSQYIFIHKFEKLSLKQIGFKAKTSFNLITNTSLLGGKNLFANESELSLIFPMVGHDDESKINIEFFFNNKYYWSTKTYNNLNYGIRFNSPLNF